MSHDHLHLIVTKHGKPILRVSPYKPPAEGGLNALKETAIWKDDLITPIDIAWEVIREDTDVHS
ncbi:MAG: type II toxin-antitoxin system Phd/YefM family antitoxin [Janthinobacterium lividum]